KARRAVKQAVDGLAVPKDESKKGEEEEDRASSQYHRLVRRSQHLSRRAGLVVRNIRLLAWQTPARRHKRAVLPPPSSKARQAKAIGALGIHDPGYWRQWHLYNDEQPSNDINVTGVWQQGGWRKRNAGLWTPPPPTSARACTRSNLLDQ